ncbi:carbohydrate ABC transporter permease [Halanaerobium sp. ST460_2HS_T2]|uniref:carbohydrate ABC transporter permease n=1 Tax=Halanaerobium sp. ST460_2HS_T2 TaxID=2183914 RepID=UPI000DF37B03|nr:sugar ABC transporter permease [Halanaerobium sp. ST460_2HS_T2]RCW50611.1 carbohydrate ABC transporter membrane protein 1 (CUT1 family) [Halanaerobium sp. ST460_2HS_T2]
MDSNDFGLTEFFSEKTQKKLRFVLLGLIPAYIFYLLYLIVPIPLSFYYSLFSWSGIKDLVFVGLENWQLVLQDEIFWKALSNNFLLVILSLLIQIPIGLLLGVFISKKIKGYKIFRVVFFLPYIMSAVAVGILFSYIYDPNFGLLNNLLQMIGLGSLQSAWLGNRSLAIFSVIGAISWRFTPFYMILFSAALVSIPQSIYEAARIDGARGWQRFFSITLPMIKPTIVNACILSLTGSLKAFGLAFTMTGGGPNHASELMATYMYKTAFTDMEMGYGSTIGIYLFLIAFSISMTVLFFSKRKK